MHSRACYEQLQQNARMNRNLTCVALLASFAMAKHIHVRAPENGELKNVITGSQKNMCFEEIELHAQNLLIIQTRFIVIIIGRTCYIMLI
jgi:hypothetical protein